MSLDRIKLIAEILNIVVDTVCEVVDRRRDKRIEELEREIAELKQSQQSKETP